MKPSTKITRSIRDEEVPRAWLVVDAEGQTLGRLATQVATLIRGKHKALYTPHVDCGDFVIVLNAEKIQLTGKRTEMKQYFHYTGYPGGGRIQTFTDLVKRKPEFVIEHAVKGMLPKTRLGKAMVKKLKVYRGDAHPHEAQSPQQFNLL